MSTRLRRTTCLYAVVLAIGVAYLFFIRLTDVRIPCFFFVLTGLQCPGCGVTHMMEAAARLDFAHAFACNPFLFSTAPLLAFVLVYATVRYVRHGDARFGWVNVLLWAELLGAIAFGVLRNIL